MKKNIIKYFDVMLLIIILIASTLLTRSTQNFKKIEIAINIVMIFYIIIRHKKIHILQSKLDIFVILLVISTIIPIVTNTYISLSMSVNAVLDYITMFWVYLLTREICQKDGNNIKYIKNIFIFFTVILIFIGIEDISSNKILEFLRIDIGQNGETRLASIFGNPNVFSSIIMISFFISINELINTDDNRKKIKYEICNTIFITGIILTYSKLTFLIFPCILLIYIISTKEKSKKLCVIRNVIISFIFALLYIFIFQKLASHQYYIGIWIFTIIWAIILALFNKIIDKNSENIKLKKIVAIMLTFILLSTIWFVLELHNGKEFVVFYKNTISDYNSKIIKNINPNEKYIFDFDMNAEIFSEENIEDMFTIKVIQRGSKGIEEIISDEYTFGNFSGTKEIEIFTTPDTSEIKLEFRAKKENINKYWVINKLTLNGKEIILEYEHLPTKLIEKLKDINIQYRTATIRFDFIKDGLKLISQNFITGIGGGGWFNKYGEVQEREYIAIDPHNYYLQIWIEFGIIGFISIIAITYLVFSFKYKEEEQKSIYRGFKFAIFALLLRSMLDLDMYFLSIRLIFFLCLGVLGSALQKSAKKKETFIANIVLLILAVITATVGVIPEMSTIVRKVEKEIINTDKNSNEYKEYNRQMIKLSDKMLKYERSYSSTIQYETKKVQAYINSGEKNLNDVLQRYYEKMLSIKNKWLYNEEKIIEKSTAITTIISMLKEQNNPDYFVWIEKLAKINVDEFNETKNQLTKVLNEKYKDTEEINYLILLKNYNYAVQIIENKL